MTKKELHIDKEQLLNSNRKYFDSCILIAQRLFKEELYEDCINYIEKTASFGWFNFSGYYKSEHLETLLTKIQKKIFPLSSQPKKKEKTNKILHICSEIYTSGGHSKLIYSWITNDKLKKHTILSTRLSVDEIAAISKFHLPDFNDLEHLSVKSPSKIESIKLLNQLPLNEYDVILLHIHPNETITSIVLSQEAITTPVCFINHADHVFWLGTSISDVVLQIRESNISIDAERRGIPKERQLFLPIPVMSSININEKPTIDHNNTINILSTGTAYKYKPNEQYNFLREAYKTIEENPEVIFNIVGINPDSSYAQEYQHKRIIYHGIVSSSDLAELEKKTDIYVEGFPMASFTALLQTALRKIPFILHYKPLPLFKLFSENKEYCIRYPEDLQEWRQTLNKLIREKKYREEIAQKQYNYILNNFSIEVWKSRKTELYHSLAKKSHRIWQSTSDKYYNGDNEKLLVTIDKRQFQHYSFTERMSLIGKFLVYKISRHKNININYFSKKQLLKYFFNK
ncbi:hypothetical protein DRF59_03020 [Chryseobacterium flavum]|uniref:Glycosyltransferase family 1 protein n=1 Tax=Chryseobacterium flavum TaxID=415851 RepID=A0A3D9CT98_9FLAO|nr:glycosyltransferase family 1 protein [Chryseobacterium flavum]REC68878.1 hypothetical protein DRF59_03020 [Chryseobacterium flavum]